MLHPHKLSYIVMAATAAAVAAVALVPTLHAQTPPAPTVPPKLVHVECYSSNTRIYEGDTTASNFGNPWSFTDSHHQLVNASPAVACIAVGPAP